MSILMQKYNQMCLFYGTNLYDIFAFNLLHSDFVTSCDIFCDEDCF